MVSNRTSFVSSVEEPKILPVFSGKIDFLVLRFCACECSGDIFSKVNLFIFVFDECNHFDHFDFVVLDFLAGNFLRI